MLREPQQNGFTLAQYRFHLTPRETLEMPATNKGTTLRGGFGTLFRRLVCIDLRLEGAACDLQDLSGFLGEVT